MNADSTMLFQQAVSNLMKETKAYLDGLDLIPRNSGADMVLLALVSKSIVLTEAIVSLVENGFEDEAYGLCRTSLEIQLTIRYLTNKDTATRCWRYLYFFAKDRVEWSRLIKKYYPDMEQQRLPSAAHEQLATTYTSPHKWSDCPDGLKGFAMEPDCFETRADGSPLDEAFYYEVLYKWMSFYVHATISGVEPQHMTDAGDIFRVDPGKGRLRHGKDALRISMLTVHLNLLRVLRNFNMEYPDHLSGRYESIVKEFVPSRR